GILAAVVPAFVYRTMGGWFEDHSLGFLWMVVGFAFLARAMKSEKVSSSVLFNSLAAVSFFVLMFYTWAAYILIPPIVAIYFVLLTYSDAVKPSLQQFFSEKPVRKKYFFFILSVFVLLATIPMLVWVNPSGFPDGGAKNSFGLFQWGVEAAIAFSLGFLVLLLLGEKARKTVRESRSLLLATSFATGIVLWFFASPSLAIVLFFFSLGLYPSLGFHSDFSTVFSRVKYRAALVAGVIVLFVVLGFIAKTDLGIGVLAYRLGETFAIDSCDQRLEQTGVTSALTGEQSPGCRYWFNKYSFLVFFPFLALALIPYKVFTEKGRRADFLLLAWVLVTMYFAYRQLKATYYFGLPVAASTAYVLAHFRSRLSGVYSANFFAFTTLLVLLGGIGAGMFFITTNSPSIHPGDDLDKVISWLRGNTPQESTKIVNWWGIGHIVSMLSERAVLSDNRQSLLHYAGDIYLAQSEEEAVQKMRELKATHVLVSYGDLAGIESIAQYTYQRLDDPRVQNYSAL
ncbi:MAG TPA: STT3 domain-containing protein, partial [archaeon]|nr:STT3 domain-containing protein [archaeon]